MALAAARLLLILLFGLATPAFCHDPSAWGGVYRSRDDGGSWLAVDADLFIGAALAVAVSPTDPNHLLYATDTRLLRSRNGGRDWSQEAAESVYGATLAVAFGRDGRTMLATTADGVFRGRDGEPWRKVDAPSAALPARVLTTLGAPGQFLLAGRRGMFRSVDDGATWRGVGEGLPDAPITAITRVTGPVERLFAIADGNAFTSIDGGGSWRAVALPVGRTETISADREAGSLWAFAAGQVHRSNDDGATWQPVGRPTEAAGTVVRGMAVADGGRTFVLATLRGLHRSVDGGQTWAQVEGALPTKLEAGLLLRDPHDTRTLYAGFALTPYAEIWRGSERSRGFLADAGLPVLATGAAAIAAIAALAVLAVRRRRAPLTKTETPHP